MSTLYTEEADVRTEMLRVTSDFQERLSTGSEQQAVDQGRQFVRQRKDYVHVRCGKQFPAACGEPLVTRVGLAFWAMPIAA